MYSITSQNVHKYCLRSFQLQLSIIQRLFNIVLVIIEPRMSRSVLSITNGVVRLSWKQNMSTEALLRNELSTLNYSHIFVFFPLPCSRAVSDITASFSQQSDLINPVVVFTGYLLNCCVTICLTFTREFQKLVKLSNISEHRVQRMKFV